MEFEQLKNEWSKPAVELACVFAAYRRLCAAGESALFDAQYGLGGKLYFVGALNVKSARAILAANLAGAATLAVAEDALEGKQAMREGALNFLVNSLDEALRILKNEVRKKETVAVGVQASLAAVVAEMSERGVWPDVWLEAAGGELPWPRLAAIRAHAELVRPTLMIRGEAKALSGLDESLRELIAVEDLALRRWHELAPRALSRLAPGLRVLDFAGDAAREKAREFAVGKGLEVVGIYRFCGGLFH